jgi:hypothetical protein
MTEHPQMLTALEGLLGRGLDPLAAGIGAAAGAAGTAEEGWSTPGEPLWWALKQVRLQQGPAREAVEAAIEQAGAVIFPSFCLEYGCVSLQGRSRDEAIKVLLCSGVGVTKKQSKRSVVTRFF